MGKRTSYAKAMEQISAKRGKYEKQLEDALRTGDRFGINSAERSIERIKSFEQELFNSQEQQKIDKGITPPQPQGMPMFNIGGPTGEKSLVGSGEYYNPTGSNMDNNMYANYYNIATNMGLQDLFNSALIKKSAGNIGPIADGKGNKNWTPEEAAAFKQVTDAYRNGASTALAFQGPDYSGIRPPFYDVSTGEGGGFAKFARPDYSVTTPDWLKDSQDVTVPKVTSVPEVTPVPKVTPSSITPKTREAEDLLSLTNKAKSSAPGGLNLIETPLVQPSTTLQPQQSTFVPRMQQAGYNIGEGLKTGLNAAGKIAPYALQFAPDLIALRQLNKLQRPEDMPMEQVTQMNTDVDTSATIARIKDNAMAFNAGVDSGMSNSAAVQNVKLAQLAQTNKQVADVGQQEENTERQLRNQQAALATGTFNRNLVTDRNNRQQLADFDNMITNARLGIVQGMGTKSFQMLQEKNQIDLDKDRLDTLKRQFDPGLIQRNFQNILKDDPTAMAETDLQSLAASIKQYPSLGDQLKIDNPKLYDAIIKLG